MARHVARERERGERLGRDARRIGARLRGVDVAPALEDRALQVHRRQRPEMRARRCHVVR
jgi:hypothetical protein